MKTEIILNIFNMIILMTTLITVMSMIKAHKRSVQIITADMWKMAHLIAHLYFLIDMIGEALPPPLRMLFQQFRALSPEKLPKNKKEEFNLLRDLALERFTLGRTGLLEAIKTETDPEEKKRLQSHLVEIEGMIILLSSIDKDTSEEYMTTVIKDLMASMHKLSGIERDNF